MKNSIVKLIIVAMAVVFHFSTAHSMSNEARSLLITKFERIYLQLAPSDPARNAVILRLADLLAERARVASMEELNKGCVACTAGVDDRRRSIELYEEALPNLQKSKRAKVLAQLGHLMELSQRSSEAEALYKKIIAEEKDPEFIAEAKLSLAEMSFKKRDYKKSYDFYTQVLAEPEAKRKSLAAYRQAWCLFNLGKVEEAVLKMETILNTPSLLTKSSEGVVSVDPHYKAEVAKDYSTFVAKKGATLDDIQNVYKLSPESSRMSNISYLANELERLGQKSFAISAYNFVLEKEEQPKKGWLISYVWLSFIKTKKILNPL